MATILSKYLNPVQRPSKLVAPMSRQDIAQSPQAASLDTLSITKAPAYVLLGQERLSPSARYRIRQTINEAVELFSLHFGEVKRPVVLDFTDQAGALRTGFHPESDTIRFPSSPKIREQGSLSEDVIAHETFHALLFQAYPQYFDHVLVSKPEYVRLHEGLADYFAYQLNPDDEMGEDYLKDRAFLRHYRNSRRLSLTAGGHGQGNALTSYLLEHNIQPQQIGNFLKRGDFSLQALSRISPDLSNALALDQSFSLEAVVSSDSPSRLNRYRLEEGESLRVDFQPNHALRKAHPRLAVEWRLASPESDSYTIVSDARPGGFKIEAGENPRSAKFLAVFKENDEVLGFQPFYFGPELAI